MLLGLINRFLGIKKTKKCTFIDQPDFISLVWIMIILVFLKLKSFQRFPCLFPGIKTIKIPVNYDEKRPYTFFFLLKSRLL